jgi:hypothetical protein
MVGRPAGKPPLVISSKPVIPVDAFFNSGKVRDDILDFEDRDERRWGEIFCLAK